MRTVFRETIPLYPHITVVSFLSYALVMFFFKLYEPVVNRAYMIHSQSGIFFLIKQVVILGTPYFNLFLSVLANTILAYVLPIIVIEKKKFWTAIILNFKALWRSFGLTLLLITIPALFFVPILLLRSSLAAIELMPEIGLWALVLSTFVTVTIDAVVYTAITTAYLLEKENT